MKKSKKIFLRLLPVVIVLLVFTFNSAVLGVKITEPTKGTASTSVTNVTGKIWGTVSAIVQVLAIAAVVLAGVRYMFASADTKADIKGEMIKLVIGGILVFLAVPVIQFVVNVADEII